MESLRLLCNLGDWHPGSVEAIKKRKKLHYIIVADNNLQLGEQLGSETDIDLEHTDKYTTE